MVWFEQHQTIVGAIQREKSLKKYKRDWKINLIERDNPGWLDLELGFAQATGALPRLAAPGAATSGNEPDG